jgi:hypothetical protein
MSIWIEPALADAALAGLERPCDTCVDLRLQVVGRALVRKTAPGVVLPR